MDRTVKSRVGGATFALAAALALVWASMGVAHADVAPSATFQVIADVTTDERTTPPTVTTTITTVVNLDFSDALRTTGPDPSAVTVTVGGVAPEYSSRSLTFHHRRLTVTLVERRDGAVTEAELQTLRDSAVRVSYTQPTDGGVEPLRYETGSDVGSFDVTATYTTREEAAESFVEPAEPVTVTGIIRDKVRPASTTILMVEPVASSTLDVDIGSREQVDEACRKLQARLAAEFNTSVSICD